MNNLNSRQRRILYVVGIIVLLVPIVLLGMPASQKKPGGVLAKLRAKHDLGESDLGQIDPTSASMNLVLLGLRGVAVNMLRMDLERHKNMKNWAELRSTTEAVITLQPHYVKVWQFLSWNMAYNVSAEWDAIPDRYYWVKEGGKFAQRGTKRNRENPELLWDTGKVWGQKVGNSDEWSYFRTYFLEDPDESADYTGSVDPEVNPGQMDNFLVAKLWQQKANDAEGIDNRQHIMQRMLFRASPYRSQFSYAGTLQREGKFTAVTVAAWKKGFDDWTSGFGRMPFRAPPCVIKLEANEDDVDELAKESNVAAVIVQKWINNYQNTSNYRYWRDRSLSEGKADTAKAHQLIFDGEEEYKKGELDTALEKLTTGMALFAAMLDDHPELAIEDETIREGMWAVYLWREILELQQETIPENYELKGLWDRHQNGNTLHEIEKRFNRLGL